jgi:hypothetical protein
MSANTLNLAEGGDKELARYGARIARLLQSPEAQKNHLLVATLDDFLGAVYALIFARHNEPPFQDRSGPIEVPVILKRAENVAACTIRTSGTWLAGFHFNSALFRIAAAYHRGLKVVSGKGTSKRVLKGDLLKIVEPAFPSWRHEKLEHIYREVNDLKHQASGLSHTRKVTWAQPKAGVEELIDLLEQAYR